MGYVHGAFDMINLVENVLEGKPHCVPSAQVTLGQVIRIFVKYRER